jgi:dipeptidase
VLVSPILLQAASDDGCFGVVVGKDASVDGYVIMAHNEDDSPPQIVNHHKVPRLKHYPGEKVELLGGGELEQVELTWSYIWSEMPKMTFSDSYLNEWGVCIASDNCPSREDNPDITDGGISYMLRRLVAERARTAREGVLLAGGLVERFGYDASGRTYTICDPDQGWLFCAVNGKHWLAKRVPDNEVAVIPNTYTVHEVDLNDGDNFLASRDIIEYAISREWYDPENDGPFDFATAYADRRVASDSSNICRQWGGFRHISIEPIALDEKLPFSVIPKHRLDVAAVMKILRDHYEDTELFYSHAESGNPHESGVRTICAFSTQTSFVAQLRKNMPLDIGIVYWVCLSAPCTSCFIPFHFGITEFPSGFSWTGGSPSDEFYGMKIESPFEVDTLEAFWTFKNFQQKIDPAYGAMIANVNEAMASIEQDVMRKQDQVEENALKLYTTDRAAASGMLFDYSNGVYHSAMEAMRDVLSGK